ncbi:MAG: hypothetical protein IKD55_12785 [Sediminibacterium sp.]|nr:hypothetical protein [Sediminibacterium sp.]
MRWILFLFMCNFFILQSCKSTKTKRSVVFSQGITGIVEEISGNQMPRIGREPDKPKPFPTTVFFYAPTDITQVQRIGETPLYTSIFTKLIATTETDSLGKFTVSLPPGRYSVFVQVEKKFFANNFDIRNNISLVTVEENKLADIKILVNHKATN